MEVFVRRYSKNSVVISLLLIILSLFLIIKPDDSLIFVVRLFGCVLIINGIVHFITYFATSKKIDNFSFELVQGVVSLIAGIVLFVNPILVNSILPFIIGAWIIIESIIKFQIAFNVRSISPRWKISLLLSIVLFLIGILIMLNPFGTAITIARLCGICLLISEIISLVNSIFFINLSK